MSFHECGGNVGDNVHIPLPKWVIEIGGRNPDIFFMDSEGRQNHECLTWGIDKERVLRGRTAVEVYNVFNILLSIVCFSFHNKVNFLFLKQLRFLVCQTLHRFISNCINLTYMCI